MTTTRKWALLCGTAALLAIAAFSSATRADEARFQEKSVTEGNRGGRRYGGGRHHGGGWHRGGGWGWTKSDVVVDRGAYYTRHGYDHPDYCQTYGGPARSGSSSCCR